MNFTWLLADQRSAPAARRITTVIPMLALLVASGVTSCGGDDPGGSDQPGEGSILLVDANNFSGTADLDPPIVETAADQDVEVCWDAVSQDLLCHDFDAVETLFLLRVAEGSESAVIEQILSQDLNRISERILRHELQGDEATHCVNFSDFAFGSAAIELSEEYFESDEHTYVLLFSTGNAVTKGARSLMLLNPTSESDVTNISGEAGCGLLDYTADLSSLETVEVPSEGPWVVNWSGLTKTGDGNDVPFTGIDRVLVGFYEGRDVEYLETNIFDIEIDPNATIWEVEVEEGRSANLADATARDGGDAFPGFDIDAEGTWLLGLFCSGCTSPAPVFLTILDPS